MELPKGIKLLVFDFDGTLFDLDIDWEAVRRDFGIADTNEKVGDALQRLLDEKNPLVEKLTEHELAALEKGRLDPRILTALDDLATRYKLALCSRNAHKVLEKTFEGTPLAGKLFIVGREDTKRLKPDPEGVQKILEHFGIQPNQAALIGDTYHDVQAAQAAGVMSIIVRNPRLAYRPGGADAYVENVAELK